MDESEKLLNFIVILIFKKFLRKKLKGKITSNISTIVPSENARIFLQINHNFPLNTYLSEEVKAQWVMLPQILSGAEVLVIINFVCSVLTLHLQIYLEIETKKISILPKYHLIFLTSLLSFSLVLSGCPWYINIHLLIRTHRPAQILFQVLFCCNRSYKFKADNLPSTNKPCLVFYSNMLTVKME